MVSINRLIRGAKKKFKQDPLGDLLAIEARIGALRYRHSQLSKIIRNPSYSDDDRYTYFEINRELGEIEEAGRSLSAERDYLILRMRAQGWGNVMGAPRLGERLLLLILTKEERVNIPGDLEEEYRGILAKHGVRYAKLWYYKQVAASAWPMVLKAVKWGVLAGVGAWIRRSF